MVTGDMVELAEAEVIWEYSAIFFAIVFNFNLRSFYSLLCVTLSLTSPYNKTQ